MLLKYYSVEIGYISFFSSSDTHQPHHLLRCHVTGINSSFNSFLSALPFSNLACQAKSLIRTMVSGSSSWKLLSRLILLISILRIPVSLHLNITSPESSLK